MLDFIARNTEDGFLTTSYNELIRTDLNKLPDDINLDLIDDNYPECRFSKERDCLFIQLRNKISFGSLDFHLMEECRIAIEKQLYSYREKGFFVYDNEVAYNSDKSFTVDWSFQRKLPVITDQLLVEIKEVHKVVQNGIESIVKFCESNKAPLEEI